MRKSRARWVVAVLWQATHCCLNGELLNFFEQNQITVNETVSPDYHLLDVGLSLGITQKQNWVCFVCKCVPIAMERHAKTLVKFF